jgi:hypothetical protein
MTHEAGRYKRWSLPDNCSRMGRSSGLYCVNHASSIFCRHRVTIDHRRYVPYPSSPRIHHLHNLLTIVEPIPSIALKRQLDSFRRKPLNPQDDAHPPANSKSHSKALFVCSYERPNCHCFLIFVAIFDHVFRLLFEIRCQSIHHEISLVRVEAATNHRHHHQHCGSFHEHTTRSARHDGGRSVHSQDQGSVGDGQCQGGGRL